MEFPIENSSNRYLHPFNLYDSRHRLCCRFQFCIRNGNSRIEWILFVHHLHTAALNFGNLDPSNPVDVTTTTSVLFRCFRWFVFPVTFFIGDDDGLYETGPNANRMRHTSVTTEYLPYNFTLNPQSGTVTGNWANHTLTITGTVRGVDYQDATMGNYSDRVVISIEP